MTTLWPCNVLAMLGLLKDSPNLVSEKEPMSIQLCSED